MADSPYLFCIYAEDVRQEISGQVSIIGVFQGGLRVASVPSHIPKLAVIANLNFPIEQAPKSIKLEVYRDGEVLQTIEPPEDFLKSAATKPSEEVKFYTMQFVVGFNVFPVLSKGRLEVRAIFDGMVIQGNPLIIIVGEETPPVVS